MFLIGMRINQWHRVRTWWPAFAAMSPMLRELYADPTSGLLGHRTTLAAGGPLLVQYWSGLDQLLAYAQDSDAHHRPAWKAFNARAATAGPAVGVWHETYHVAAGHHESIYSGMPLQGLAKATSHVRVGPRSDRAAQRLGDSS